MTDEDSSLKGARTPRRAADVRLRIVGNRNLLLKVQVTMEINDIGMQIWKLCDGQHSEEDIAFALTQSYEVDHAMALNDISRFLNEMVNAYMIEWRD